MLKEVGSSGQISLGKRFAGQLYDVSFLDSGEVSMKPVRLVSAIQAPNTAPATLQVDDAAWLAAHAHDIAAYNAWAENRPTFSESVRQWRDALETQSMAASVAT